MTKRIIKVFLVTFALFLSVFGTFDVAKAANKTDVTRNIAIVFDNSGSMYSNRDKAWCRATYAMEVFASMLNKGDTLAIYPMHPINVGNNEYTMDNPFKVTDSSQAQKIRDIYTEYASVTPIESVDRAIYDLRNIRSGKNYLIVLTDGNAFYKNDRELSAKETKKELDKRFEKNAGSDMTAMYLGVGKDVVMPNTKESEYFVKRQAEDSEDVLTALTDMCNLIFGRDILPKGHIKGKNVDFDISIKKLIVFVQGENISDLKVLNGSNLVGTQTNVAMTRYGTAGCGNYTSIPDKSLQGMMVTYENCEAGNYTIEYSGKATRTEIYYEPDVDLEFVFTDSSGNSVDPMNLYEGEYKVSFGMKDAKTGKLSESDLLGNPKYSGKYYINGKEHDISYQGKSGEVPIKLNLGDTFEAHLTVNYLSGYTISKDSTEFGWPKGGIVVAARPAGNLRLEISDGEKSYSLLNLEEGKPYKLKIYYKDKLLTGENLKAVLLNWDNEKSSAIIEKEFAQDHYVLSLKHKDTKAPEKTKCGECDVSIKASYTEKGSNEAKAETVLKYKIEEDAANIEMELSVPEDYLVISDLDETQANIVHLKKNGKNLTKEEFKAVKINVDCGGIKYDLIPDPDNSAFKIQFKDTKNITAGDYQIKVTAEYTDKIGRVSQANTSKEVELGVLPLWMKVLFFIILIILLIIIIMIILHIKVYPKKAHVEKRDCVMIFDGEDVSKSTSFTAKIDNGKMSLQSKYAGSKAGIKMDVKRGKNSYLKNSQVKRTAEVKSNSVSKIGTATITELSIGSIRYILNEDTGKLERQPASEKPYELKHNMRISYSGTMQNAGSMKPFTVTTKLNFKKK